MAVIQAARVDSAVAVKVRLEQFGCEVLAQAMNRPAQIANGGLYLRGLVEGGKRKSLKPMVERLGGEADYQSMQQFLTDSPWDPAEVVRAVVERVAPVIDVEAWVLDDTGFPKQGKRSPGSSASTRGRWGRSATAKSASRCTRSALGGRCRWGGRCICPRSGARTRSGEHRRRSPMRSSSRRSSQLGQELIERAGSWNIKRAPVLG